MRITKEFRFEAAHRLVIPGVDTGKCFNMHGHSYVMKVSLFSPSPNTTSGMIMNYVDLKRIVNENIIDILDHSLLNDSFPIVKAKLEDFEDKVYLISDITTSEIMSIVIAKVIAKTIEQLSWDGITEKDRWMRDLAPIVKVGVELFETATSSCYYEYPTRIYGKFPEEGSNG